MEQARDREDKVTLPFCGIRLSGGFSKRGVTFCSTIQVLEFALLCLVRKEELTLWGSLAKDVPKWPEMPIQLFLRPFTAIGNCRRHVYPQKVRRFHV